MARRRYRRKYTWMPTHSLEVERTGQAAFLVPATRWAFTYGPGVDVAHQIYPLMYADLPVEEVGADTLSDVIGSEYVCERIVGNFFCSSWAEGTIGGEIPGASLISFGIFVGRADANFPDEPAGASGVTAEESSRNFNPLEFVNIREPWMFRRTWVLSHGLNVNGTLGTLTSNIVALDERAAASTSYPRSTAGYWGRDSGPFIDVKSVRRIRTDERLWGIVSAMPYPVEYGGANPTGTWAIRTQAHFDYRILGALRKAKNRSNF